MKVSLVGVVLLAAVGLGTGSGCVLPAIIQAIGDAVAGLQVAAQAVTIGANLANAVADINARVDSGELTAADAQIAATVAVIDTLSGVSPAVIQAAVGLAGQATGTSVPLTQDQAESISRVVTALDPLTEDDIRALANADATPLDPNATAADISAAIQDRFGITVSPDDLEQLRGLAEVQSLVSPGGGGTGG